MFTIYGGKTEFNQWEQGQRVTNPKLTVGNKVRFWNATGETHPMIAYMHEGVVVADVPNDLLQHCSPLLVQLCGDPECLTRFIVNAQKKPADYVFIDNTHCEYAHSSGGGVSSWNDLTDKPFDENNIIKHEALPEGYPYKEEGINLRWDGNKEGRDVCYISMDFEVNLYKVSDEYFDAYALETAEIVGSEYTIGRIDRVDDLTEYVGFPAVVCITNRLSALVSVSESVNVEGFFTAPSAGTYLADLSSYTVRDNATGTDCPIGYVKSVTTSGAFIRMDKRLLPKEVECGTVVEIDTVTKLVMRDVPIEDVFLAMNEGGTNAVNIKLVNMGHPRTIIAKNWRSGSGSLDMYYIEPNYDGSSFTINRATLHPDETVDVVTVVTLGADSNPA